MPRRSTQKSTLARADGVVFRATLPEATIDEDRGQYPAGRAGRVVQVRQPRLPGDRGIQHPGAPTDARDRPALSSSMNHRSAVRRFSGSLPVWGGHTSRQRSSARQ